MGEVEKATLTPEGFSAGGILQLEWPRQKVKTSVGELAAVTEGMIIRRAM